jgi:hypothetical protein
MTNKILGLGVKHLFGIYKALGSIPSIAKKKKRKRKRRKEQSSILGTTG